MSQSLGRAEALLFQGSGIYRPSLEAFERFSVVRAACGTEVRTVRLNIVAGLTRSAFVDDRPERVDVGLGAPHLLRVPFLKPFKARIDDLRPFPGKVLGFMGIILQVE